jgi:hypothetical protein
LRPPRPRGHRDFKTPLIYADYAPSEREADLINAAFAIGTGLVPEDAPESFEAVSETAG